MIGVIITILKDIDEIAKDLDTDLKSGLSNSSAQQRLIKYGKNELLLKKPQPWYLIFIGQLITPLPIILILAAVISVLASNFIDHKLDFTEFIVIILIVLINSLIATIEEMKARASVTALNKMVSPKAVVIRESILQEIDLTNLTVGDIVALDAGNYVPADIRLFDVSKLMIDESSLTGESSPVQKINTPLTVATTVLAEMKNMAFASTYITNGRGFGVVTAIGMQTEIGKISERINQTQDKTTPLQSKVNWLSKLVTILAVVIAVVVFLLMYFLNSDDHWSHALLTAITLAIAVIPESLPIIISVILSYASKKMSRINVILKNLQAVETLGAVNVICSDKTGTLTQNRMTIQTYFFRKQNVPSADFVYENTNQQHFHFFNALILCNDAIHTSEQKIGDPTEIALIDWTKRFDINTLIHRKTFPRLDGIPFDSERKLMSSVNSVNRNRIVYVKGAIDQLLTRCANIAHNNQVKPLTDNEKIEIQNLADNNSRLALRVLGFAYKVLPKNTVINHEELETNLTFLGGVGMIDPPRTTSLASIQEAHQAGIRVIMITGDHKKTAYAIARQLTIVNNETEVLSGEELNELTPDELKTKLSHINVFARVNPEHKVKIVESLQQQNLIVAMTGDGVNDAPSLVKSDIGIAMGITGTDVSKQAANLVLTDDNFSSIINGVKEGRNVYQKLKIAIAFILGSNLAQLLAMLVVILISHVTPLEALNVLWFNLIVESILAIPIGMTKNDNNVMQDKPRNAKERLFKYIGFEIGLTAVITAIAVVAAFYVGAYGLTANHHFDLLGGKTLAFFVMINAPVFYITVVKMVHFTNHKNSSNILKFNFSWQLAIAMGIAFVLNVIIFYIPYVNDRIFTVMFQPNYRYILSGIGLMFFPALAIHFINSAIGLLFNKKIKTA